MVVDLKKLNARKIWEIILVILILAGSVAIFIFKDKIEHVSEAGYLGVFLFCFLANSTVLIPAPSLMIAASCALIMNPILVAIFASLGSALGEFVGYAFGTVTEDLSPKFQKFLDKLNSKIHNKTLMVFILAVLPLPLFDVAGVYSGGTRMNVIKFFLACFIGKFIKTLIYTRIYDILEWAGTLLPGIGGLVK